MPFVYADKESKEPPYKRRKLQHRAEMARYSLGDLGVEQWLTNDDTSPTKSRDHSVQRNDQDTDDVVRTSSREELMECIKRGQKSMWVPTPGFLALCEEEKALQEKRKQLHANTEHHQEVTKPESSLIQTPTREYEVLFDLHSQHVQSPQRPRSALHRGNFSDETSPNSDVWPNPTFSPGLAISTDFPLGASPPHWYSDSPRPTSIETSSHGRALSQINTSFTNRRRAPSLGSSLSSSFVMRVPTSPLVHATSNPYLDLQTTDSEPDKSKQLRDASRRRTLPPNSFHSINVTPTDSTLPNFSRPLPPSLRREISMPLPSPQFRRSMSSFTYQPRPNSSTPILHSRRPSMTSEGASRRRTSMVGSFEESILRGRMSTPPSKPLEFVAQIGVMGKGDCPSNLKCPAHVSVPFPAVFYNYSATIGSRSVSDETPSPYVGTIDLDRNLKPIVLATKRGRKSTSSQNGGIEDLLADQDLDGREPSVDPGKIAIGGAYRVPKQGQLQIILKNPNKTAVKLFLVPYDLEGMEAGTKTFIRQRSFSSGSIIENVLSDKSIKPSSVDPLESKQILRYLIHLKFCCPAKNRFYLHDDVRVVFANRVPDGKEKLRNEVYLPDPRFSPYKPSPRETIPRIVKSVPSTPRNDSFEFESSQFFGDMDGIQMHSPVSPTGREDRKFISTPIQFPLISPPARSAAWDLSEAGKDIEKTAFQFPDIKRVPSRSTITPPLPARALSPVTGFEASSSSRGSPLPWRPPPINNNNNTRSFSPVPIEAGNGLLSRQFRELNGQTKIRRSTSPEQQSDTGSRTKD